MPDSKECYNDLVRFLASGQADNNDSQCLDTKFHQNTNDYLLDHMISSNIKSCIYTDFINFDNRINFHNSLFMLHFNIRSLQKNLNSFYEALQLLPTLPQIICISETKINKEPLTNISISNYSFVCTNSNTRAGGVGFYLKALNKKLCEFKSNKYDIYLFGDININIYNNQSNSISDEYLSMLASNGLFQLITKPTRVTDTSASLIDHIFASSLSNLVCPGIILNDISDHFMTYCAISLRAKPQSTEQIKYLVRDINNLKIDDFLCRLDNDMRHFAPFLNDITADNYNFIFSKFLQIVRSAIDFYAPLRQASRRQKRIQSKPWLTKGLN